MYTPDFKCFDLGPDISLIPLKAEKHFKIKIKNFAKDKIPDKEKTETLEESYSIFNCTRGSQPLEKCPVCKKFFRRMKTHLLKHNIIQGDRDDSLTCKLCMKLFNTHSNLSIHMRLHTGGAKLHVCDICNKSFVQSCNLINHKRIHSGERPFKCPFCGRGFTQSGNLNNHIRLHTDEKPFRCHFCDRAFTQSGNLNSHIRNNHTYDGGYDSRLDSM